ncbi:hypothetical protein KQX54_005512 [Cotesia glomerata]|uniref:Uncharacterized protein n=1 Tax=Cotesia glomerata TaxID=32391 RepID=A0AAV7HX19_COTGL|nr:hypothetical protein KQX54_005512 [Cotesia glomerata]
MRSDRAILMTPVGSWYGAGTQSTVRNFKFELAPSYPDEAGGNKARRGNSNLELFDSESGPDLTLSPQTFTSTAEAFINDNSDSLGVPGDNDMVYQNLMARDFATQAFNLLFQLSISMSIHRRGLNSTWVDSNDKDKSKSIEFIPWLQHRPTAPKDSKCWVSRKQLKTLIATLCDDQTMLEMVVEVPWNFFTL